MTQISTRFLPLPPAWRLPLAPNTIICGASNWPETLGAWNFPEGACSERPAGGLGEGWKAEQVRAEHGEGGQDEGRGRVRGGRMRGRGRVRGGAG